MDETEIRLWAETVAKLVADTENRLIWIIKDTADRGLGANDYAVKRLQDLAIVRARLEAELGRSWSDVIDAVQQVLDQAREAGQGQATRDLGGMDLPDTLPAQMALGVEQIARDTLRHLSGMPALILRDATDAYQQIITTPVSTVAMGAVTRRQATEDALREFARRGITSFTDRSGRQWRIDSYAEMATRTGALHSMRFGFEQTMIAAGNDLVIVSAGHGYTCPKCAPWEGKILSLTGATPTGWNEAEHATRDGVMVRFEVAGTVAEAKAAGLMHPNCEHSWSRYQPGVTTVPRPQDDPATYQASQVQRGLEREIRAAKRELAAAMSDQAQHELRVKIRAGQKQIRELLAEHPKLTRKSVREQIKTAH